jgi:hypothetical protein
MEIGGVKMMWDGTGYKVIPRPGQNPLDIHLDAAQGKLLQLFERSVVAHNQIGDASVLAGLKDSAAGKVPMVGNYWVSPEYQAAKRAADAWLLANIRNDSGAVIGKDEIPQHYVIYFPQPGDSQKTIDDMAQRRRSVMEGNYGALGQARPVADMYLEERKGRKTDEPHGTIRVNRSNGKQQRVMNGYWENDNDDW